MTPDRTREDSIRTTEADLVSADDFTVAELRAALFDDTEPSDRKRDAHPGRDGNGDPAADSPAELGQLVVLSLLARKPYDEKHEDLRRLLFDDDRESRLRHSAAVSLGRAFGQDAESTLLEALESETLTPDVRRGVLTALGAVGSEAVLDALADDRKQFSEPVRRQAAWAETLIAYRAGTPPNDERGRLSLPELVEIDGESFEVAIRAADTDVRKAALADVRRSQHHLPLAVSEDHIYELTCLNQRLLIVFDEEFVQAADAPFERKYVASVILGRTDIEADEWSPRHYLLVHPVGESSENDETEAGQERGRDRGELFITSTNGRILYGGTVVHEDDGLTFELRAVERPGLRPVRFKGRFADGDLVLEEGESAAVEPDGREPAPDSRDEPPQRR